ncbi:hypothetical protein ACGFNU_18830 [Spirillospora sp. NPDC048911]|uniref:hypothetical protein n=1 Tax=Spirillospora sp. NPDC048911 TaxID=3364527 RepID=UPI00372374CB
MMKSWLTRAAVVGGVAVTMIAGFAGTAMADDKTIRLPGGYGTMTFIDDGDVFKICDTRADGHGVSGEVWFQPWIGDEDIVLSIDDGGDAGCDKKGYNVGNDGEYQMRLCWDGPNGTCIWSDEFNE